jgi:hypothetical protein
MKQRAARICQLASWGVLAGCGLAESGPSANSGSDRGGAGATVLAGNLVDSETLITLERTACYGSCPDYSLSIAGDGTVTYLGRSYVNIKGAASKQVAVSNVQALVDQMLQADYFELSVPVECSQGIFTDAPSATTSLLLGQRTHTVEHYYGNPCAPAALQVLEDAIDEAAGSAEWLKCHTSSGVCCDPEVNPLLNACAH